MDPADGDHRCVVDLLAQWTDIDQNKLEAEKRRMLAACRAAATPSET